MASSADARPDPTDGLPAIKAGPWAVSEKHLRLRRYVGICAGVRKRFLPPNGNGGAAYFDLYCGPGRIWLDSDGSFHDGSALVAFREASRNQFTDFCIADIDAGSGLACEKRLSALGAKSIHRETGEAEHTVRALIKKLNRQYGFHIAMLDPYSLDALPFSVISALANAYSHIDFIIHFSKQDLQRNLSRFISGEQRSLDRFAPRWQAAVGNLGAPQASVRVKIVQHWIGLIRALGFEVYDDGFELVRGGVGQHLYWLVFASRHPRGNEFWDKIRNISGQQDLL